MNFDWTTFALQVVNVVVLLAILQHFLFRPVAAIIAKRRADEQRALDEAAKARAEAEKATEKARAEAASIAAARGEAIRKAVEEGEAQRKEILAKARAEAAKIIADARAAAAREEAARKAEILAELRDLAVTVAARALAAQPESPSGYVTRLAKALDGMDEEAREALLRGGNLTLVSAGSLPKSAREKAHALLARYGAEAQERTDPKLIAGLELVSDSGVLHNSLAHDLETLSEAMQNEPHAA